jgi:cell division septum initiation protein DivIVA
MDDTQAAAADMQIFRLSHAQADELLDLLEKRLEKRLEMRKGLAGSVSNRPFDLGAGNGLRAAIENQAAQADTRATSILEEIETHIRMAQRRAIDIASRLHNHADRVHGPVPKDDEKGIAQPQSDGQISAIFVALSDLDRTMSVLHEQAARNTVLA